MEADLNTPIEDLCRDDRCSLIHLHRKHEIKHLVPNRDLFTCNWYMFIVKGSAIRESILKAIGPRDCLPNREVYRRVLNDYGSTTEKTVSINLNKMVEAGILKKIRCRHIYGYCRAENPLLETDPLELEEKVEEYFGGAR